MIAMANKTYYKQNYPGTTYEYSSRGYRNDRSHCSDSRQINIPYNVPCEPLEPNNIDYSYYQNAPEEYVNGRDGQWESQEFAPQKPKFVHSSNKRALNQPAVNTPRYYRNKPHKRPSALCIPLLAQPEPQNRRKTKSQTKFDGNEKADQKGVRYRAKSQRHHLLPPPPALPPLSAMPPNYEQTDLETSSGDGRHSFRSQTQSSGSLSVDISSQLETLNQSFEAASRDREGKKIVYGEVQPVYCQHDHPCPRKPRRSHRRHSKKQRHVIENTDNLAGQLWDLPEDIQGEEVWSDKVETDWSNVEQNIDNSYTSDIIHTPRRPHTRKHHHHRPPHNFHQHLSPQPPHLPTAGTAAVPPVGLPSVPQQQLKRQAPVLAKHIQSNVPKSRTQSRELQETQTNQEMDAGSMSSNPQEETGRINYLENLFSEVFAQGRFDNLSKKTRLDFIKEAYNKYSEFEESGQLANENSEEPESVVYANEYPSQMNNQFVNDYEKNTEENRQVNQTNDEIKNKEKQSTSQDEFKSGRTLKLSQKISNSTNNSATQKSVSNYLLNVKPRKRSMKLDENEGQDSIPRFPNLIENMSARYLGSTNTTRKEKAHTANSCASGQPNRTSKSQSSNLSVLRSQGGNEYDYSCQQQQREQTGDLKESTQMPKSQVQNDQNVYSRCGKGRLNQEGHHVGNQTSNTINYQDTNSGFEYRDNDVNYCKPTTADCTNVNNQYNDQYNYNCSLVNGMTVDNVYGNNQDYSTNTENNYLTIQKCEEVLNHARENFDDCFKEDPAVFIGDDQYADSSEGNQCVYPGGSIGHHDHVGDYTNTTQHNLQLQPQIGVSYPHNETVVSNSKANEYGYEYQADRPQRCPAENRSKSNECKRNVNEDFKTQDVQTDFYSGDEIVQSYTDYENISNVNTNEYVNQKDENLVNCHDMSEYSNIDQEKVKQFIHSLTGFDVLQRHKSACVPDRCPDEYQDNNYKYQAEQTDHGYFEQTAMSASDNRLETHEHHHSSFQSLQQRPKSKGGDNPNIEKHRHYSIPQRQEIERMQQDSHSAHAVTYNNRETQGCQINYSDFPQEVPNRVPMHTQGFNNSVPNELDNSEYIESQGYHNQRCSNEIKSEHINERYYSQSDTQNVNYNVYDHDYNQFQQDQQEHNNYNQNVYLNNGKYYTVEQDGSQSSNQNNSNCLSKIDASGYPEFEQGEMADENQHAPHYQPYINNNGNQDVMDPRLHCVNNNEEFSGQNNEQGYGNGFQEVNSDSKTSVLKRKYCYMPSLTVRHVDTAVSDQSCYKNYIENLIDHSLQTAKGGSVGTSQNMNQGSVMQRQSDVVELDTGKAIDLVMNESASQLDSPLCMAITKRLTDKLVQSNTSIPTPCLVALEEPAYLQQLKKLRWDHLRHIEREVKRLESLERFLDTCGCGHMTYAENAG